MWLFGNVKEFGKFQKLQTTEVVTAPRLDLSTVNQNLSWLLYPIKIWRKVREKSFFSCFTKVLWSLGWREVLEIFGALKIYLTIFSNFCILIIYLSLILI